ncbi:hypothetical protein RhiirA4_543664 [Rhizophagus irregularis]|uniref:Uncharacterized protein n=1 Tax=Rhizophagus irregularis TaxID=588596 RepID=A0A2I1GK25_9GLOM|nr:hypothetical protein RhiirA4_543664 [Rhizophagus irregularis]
MIANAHLSKADSFKLIKRNLEAVIPIKRHYKKLFEQEFFIEGSIVILPEGRSRMESKAYAWYYASYHPSELDYDSSENMISYG